MGILGNRGIPVCLQQLAVRLAHYASEMGNAYSEDPPGETMVGYRVQQAEERGDMGQRRCKPL